MRKETIVLRGSIVALLALMSVQSPPEASADAVTSRTKREARELRAVVKRLKRLATQSSGRRTLGTLSSAGLTDSDGDGLPDLYEDILGSNSCDDDSDDDGISDGDEGRSGSRPDDSSSGEVEIEGTISAITSSTVTVAGSTFVTTPSTVYRDGATSLASFSVGDRVEVKGRLNSGVLQLVRIKLED
jgi:hypothetical protein